LRFRWIPTRSRRPKLVYNVKEGSRVKIVAVKFSGNSALKTRELKKTIKSSTRSWVFFSKYYNEEELAEDLVKLQKAYQRKGFLNAKSRQGASSMPRKPGFALPLPLRKARLMPCTTSFFTGNKEV